MLRLRRGATTMGLGVLAALLLHLLSLLAAESPVLSCGGSLRSRRKAASESEFVHLERIPVGLQDALHLRVQLDEDFRLPQDVNQPARW